MADGPAPMSNERLRALMLDEPDGIAELMQASQELHCRRRLRDLRVAYNDRIRPEDQEPVTEIEILQALCLRPDAMGEELD